MTVSEARRIELGDGALTSVEQWGATGPDETRVHRLIVVPHCRDGRSARMIGGRRG